MNAVYEVALHFKVETLRKFGELEVPKLKTLKSEAAELRVTFTAICDV
jgi:hypothetical protein